VKTKRTPYSIVFHRQGYSDERNSVDVHVYCMFSEDSSVLCDGCRSDSGCDWVLRLSVHCVGHKHRAGRSSLSTGASSRQVGERTCCSPMQPYVVQPTSVVLDDTWKLSSTVTSFSGLRLTSWLKLLTNNRIDQQLECIGGQSSLPEARTGGIAWVWRGYTPSVAWGKSGSGILIVFWRCWPASKSEFLRFCSSSLTLTLIPFLARFLTYARYVLMCFCPYSYHHQHR